MSPDVAAAFALLVQTGYLTRHDAAEIATRKATRRPAVVTAIGANPWAVARHQAALVDAGQADFADAVIEVAAVLPGDRTQNWDRAARRVTECMDQIEDVRQAAHREISGALAGDRAGKVAMRRAA